MGTNYGNHGKKGVSGRKSAYRERADARDVEAMFFGEHNQEEIEKRIRSGKFSIKDRYLLTAMEGDTRVLTSLSNKALPDKIDIRGTLTISQLLDQLDGQEIDEQEVENQPLISNTKQEGEVDNIPTEPSAS